jgi:hypothetical protein
MKKKANRRRRIRTRNALFFPGAPKLKIDT